MVRILLLPRASLAATPSSSHKEQFKNNLYIDNVDLADYKLLDKFFCKRLGRIGEIFDV